MLTVLKKERPLLVRNGNSLSFRTVTQTKEKPPLIKTLLQKVRLVK